MYKKANALREKCEKQHLGILSDPYHIFDVTLAKNY